MAETTTKKTAATKATAEKKATKACATKTCGTKTTAKKAAVIYVNAENAGFRAGDVYQILAASEKPLTVAEIARPLRYQQRMYILDLAGCSRKARLCQQRTIRLHLHNRADLLRTNSRTDTSIP